MEAPNREDKYMPNEERKKSAALVKSSTFFKLARYLILLIFHLPSTQRDHINPAFFGHG